MRLSRLYTNRPEVRPVIDFRHGLNVVLGEVHLPAHGDKDTHSLGKSLLAEVIDFCFLKASHKSFVKKHEGIFDGFVFFLELELGEGRYLTIRRAADTASKAGFKQHREPSQDFSVQEDPDDWDHWELPSKKSLQVLDGYLSLQAVSPWSFRKIVGYSLRGQGDFQDPFRLSKFGAGRHTEWKPLLAKVLGLDASLVARGYQLDDSIAENIASQKRLSGALPKLDESADQLRGRLGLQQAAVTEMQEDVDHYDFEIADAEINRELVSEISDEIVGLNERRYFLATSLERIRKSLTEHASLTFSDIRKVFSQVGVAFTDGIVKEYADLERFAASLTTERDGYLSEEAEIASTELRQVEERLSELNRKRSKALESLTEKDTFDKYRLMTARVVKKLADVDVLERQVAEFDKLAELRRKGRELSYQRDSVTESLTENVAEAGRVGGTYVEIRKHFSDIIESVIARKANIYTEVNSAGNLEFKAEILDSDGRESKAGEGHTYQRLLCIAFDLAVARTYVNASFPHFLYHDGALESLEDRKKESLIGVLREYGALGVQIVITALDSEMPASKPVSEIFKAEEIVLHLHDDGEEGRLFRRPEW